MLDSSLGRFDHVVGMDSLIHYRANDMASVVTQLAAMAKRSVLFTFAPQTPILTLMHAVGRLFPRGERAPAIEPISPQKIGALIAQASGMAGWQSGRTHRVLTGFYKSQALELVHA
jgi:magnesium-protoporphyrin O-methyltransferase